MPADVASGPPPAEQNAGCLPALKLRLWLFARYVPFQILLNFVKPVQTHGKRTSTPARYDTNTSDWRDEGNDESVRKELQPAG